MFIKIKKNLEMKKLKNLIMGEDSKGTTGKRFCPLTDNPEPDCYINDLNSRNISFALQYCQGDFEACLIYQRVINK